MIVVLTPKSSKMSTAFKFILLNGNLGNLLMILIWSIKFKFNQVQFDQSSLKLHPLRATLQRIQFKYLFKLKKYLNSICCRVARVFFTMSYSQHSQDQMPRKTEFNISIAVLHISRLSIYLELKMKEFSIRSLKIKSIFLRSI